MKERRPPEPAPEDPARACARAFLRPFVERGATLAELMQARPRYAGPDYGAQVGGAIWRQVAVGQPWERETVGPDELLVTHINQEWSLARYPLAELYWELKEGGRQGRLF